MTQYLKVVPDRGERAVAETYRPHLEMSSKTADPNFLLQKKIEKHFAEKHPDKWTPVYRRVTFSERPYAAAMAIGDKQEAIMPEILQMPNIESLWDSDKVEQKILALL